MRRSLVLTGLLTLSLTTTARADDRPFLQRWAERAPLPHVNIEHTMDRAGYPQSVSRYSTSSITRFDNGGYIGGASLRNNNVLARGPGSAIGPVYDGTYGTDYTGLQQRMGRVFLAPSDDPSRGHPIYLAYRSEGPRVKDIFAGRPFRKAVLEKREDVEERKHGKEGDHGGEAGHGEAGHGEAGHAPEGAGKEPKH